MAKEDKKKKSGKGTGSEKVPAFDKPPPSFQKPKPQPEEVTPPKKEVVQEEPPKEPEYIGDVNDAKIDTAEDVPGVEVSETLRRAGAGVGDALAQAAGVVASSAARGARFGAWKAGSLGKFAKLRMRNTLLRRKIGGILRELGEIVVDSGPGGAAKALAVKRVAGLIQMVKDCREEIRNNEAQPWGEGDCAAVEVVDDASKKKRS